MTTPETLSKTSLPFHLFEGFGIELEYMIVKKENLDVFPIADALIHKACGAYVSDVEKEKISWSNELALHVIELKTASPSPTLINLDKDFLKEIQEINTLLDPLGACLMPSAMHPWMDPLREMRLWPHEHNAIYEAFNRIFNCQGHGWANLQSMHINLPFGNEKEFEKLHAAIRLLLPLIPALAASSPVVEGKKTNLLDTRLEVYRKNAQKIPSITAHIVPEVCRSFQDYEEKIFQKIYKDIALYDPDKVLQKEWLNARGAIARFDRNSIEIRIIDIQECPKADLAIASIVVAVLQALVQERWAPIEKLHTFDEIPLKELLLSSLSEGGNTQIHDFRYLEVFGKKDKKTCSIQELWASLIDSTLTSSQKDALLPVLQTIIEKGPLAKRILQALGPSPSFSDLQEVYRKLCESLAKGVLFLP